MPYRKGHIVTDVTRNKIGEFQRSRIHLPHTQIAKNKISEEVTIRWQDPEYRERVIAKMIVAANIPERKKTRLEFWKDSEHAKTTMQKSLETNNTIRPNKPEQRVIEILKSLSSDIMYVGDGTCWVLGNNPDFINEDKKQIIEVFGCFWHGCKKCGHLNAKTQRKDVSRIDKFRRLGYSVLVVWEHELKCPEKIMLKIKKFIEVS